MSTPLPCLHPPAGGAYFKDLPNNMLGCFVIGLFAASSTLGLAVDKALAALPAAHPWQANFELQIGGCWQRAGSLLDHGLRECRGLRMQGCRTSSAALSMSQPTAAPPTPAGIRTGYCGSLTTFASWFLELMGPAIRDNQVRVGGVAVGG